MSRFKSVDDTIESLTNEHGIAILVLIIDELLEKISRLEQNSNIFTDDLGSLLHKARERVKCRIKSESQEKGIK